MLNNKQIEEVKFWDRLVKLLGNDYFLNLRKNDYKEKTKYFNGLEDEKGSGIDVGSGPVSIFEFSPLKHITAIDPLMNSYDTIVKYRNKCDYEHMDAEDMDYKDGEFDFAVCINVIDHTPHPEKLVSEIYRVLKKGSKFYFSVNFDDYLATPHYELWNEKKVDEYLNRFNKLFSKVERNDKDSQSIYYAIYEKN